MKAVSEQFVVNEKGKRVAAIIKWPRYRQLISAWEELEEIRSYDQAKKRKNKFIPIGKAFKEIENQTLNMTYFVTIERRPVKFLADLRQSDPSIYLKIKEKILALQNNPRPPGYKKLKNRDGWRIRIGVYRVIYEIHDPVKKVFVFDIGHRKNIYD